MASSIQIQLEDTSLCAYLQRYPFLTGPDESVNRRALAAIRQAVVLRHNQRDAELLRRPHAELMPPDGELQRARALLQTAGLSPAEIKNAEHDYAWRFHGLPGDRHAVLCVGSGEGHEIAFIRARLPDARIHVIDFVPKVLPGLLTACKAQFEATDLSQGLAAYAGQFDAVFSNHTLEHMYQPHRILDELRRVLMPGGILISGLPLDGHTGHPLSADIQRLAARPHKLHAVDMGLFDAGHPWKSNPGDLVQSIEEAGFTGAQVVQRADVPARTGVAFAGSQRLSAHSGAFLNRCTFGIVRKAVRVLWPDHAPLWLRRILVAVERRSSFGANRLQAAHSPDVVVTARVSSRPNEPT